MKEPDRNTTDVIKDITPDERITNALLLNASFTDNIGLMHGKAGSTLKMKPKPSDYSKVLQE